MHGVRRSFGWRGEGLTGNGGPGFELRLRGGDRADCACWLIGWRCEMTDDAAVCLHTTQWIWCCGTAIAANAM